MSRFDKSDDDYSGSHITVHRVATFDGLPVEAKHYDIACVGCTDEYPDGTIYEWMDGQWHWVPLRTFPGQAKTNPAIPWAPPQAKR